MSSLWQFLVGQGHCDNWTCTAALRQPLTSCTYSSSVGRSTHDRLHTRYTSAAAPAATARNSIADLGRPSRTSRRQLAECGAFGLQHCCGLACYGMDCLTYSNIASCSPFPWSAAASVALNVAHRQLGHVLPHLLLLGLVPGLQRWTGSLTAGPSACAPSGGPGRRRVSSPGFA